MPTLPPMPGLYNSSSWTSSRQAKKGRLLKKLLPRPRAPPCWNCWYPCWYLFVTGWPGTCNSRDLTKSWQLFSLWVGIDRMYFTVSVVENSMMEYRFCKSKFQAVQIHYPASNIIFTRRQLPLDIIKPVLALLHSERPNCIQFWPFWVQQISEVMLSSSHLFLEPSFEILSYQMHICFRVLLGDTLRQETICILAMWNFFQRQATLKGKNSSL